MSHYANRSRGGKTRRLNKSDRAQRDKRNQKRGRNSRQIIKSKKIAKEEDVTLQRKHILDAVIEFVNNNYSVEDVSIEDFCYNHKIAERTVQRALKEFNTNWRNILRTKRMAEAARLLVNTSFSVSGISTQVGYDQPSPFNKVFRKHYKITPSEYRQKYGNG